MRSWRTLVVAACLVVVPLILQQPVDAQSNPRVGTWKLNLAKSKIESGPTPKSETRTYTQSGDTVTMKGEVVAADGTKRSIGYTIERNGKDYPYMGNPDFDTIAVTGNGSADNTQLKKNGKIVGSAESVVSADGKTMTLTRKGTTADGKPFTDMRVYEKQ